MHPVSLRVNGETFVCWSRRNPKGEAYDARVLGALMDREYKSDAKGAWGGWRRNGWKAGYVKQGELWEVSTVFMLLGNRRAAPAAVRAAIVAMKRRNGRGAKGGRKVDGWRCTNRNQDRRQCPV